MDDYNALNAKMSGYDGHSALRAFGFEPENVTIVPVHNVTFGGQPMAEQQKKSENIILRVTPAQKEAIREGAQVSEQSITDFILTAVAQQLAEGGIEFPDNAEGSGTYQKHRK